jgi:hypothetical protein
MPRFEPPTPDVHPRLNRRGGIRPPSPSLWLAPALLVALLAGGTCLAAGALPAGASFPPPLESYQDAHLQGLGAVLRHRVTVAPFNLWATLLFLGAVIHTFFTQRFRHIAHVLEARHQAQAAARGAVWKGRPLAVVFHFLGEVEAVFGLWVIPLLLLMAWQVGVPKMLDYFNHRVAFTEPIFVVVIMAMSSTRPVLRLAEVCLRKVAALGGGGVSAWWFSILTLGPLLGSFVTEPAAMTIAASLLSRRFYALQPRPALAYATLGLLFVNISVGGTLTHFAAPPVLMVAAPWQWDTFFMLRHFGWEATLGVVIANAATYLVFRKDFGRLGAAPSGVAEAEADRPIPAWVTAGHLIFIAGAVGCAHYPPLLVFTGLLFLAFFEVTQDFQAPLSLRAPVLVGFFLAGLVVHGGLQQWWIGPVLGGLGETSLFFGALGLTSLNDNAAITYLATLVPNLSDGLKLAVVGGAVAGGGLTVIANAPNPAGQAILGRHFAEGISPLRLFLGALLPTAIMSACLLFLR